MTDTSSTRGLPSLSQVADVLRAGGPAALDGIVKHYGPLAARLAALHVAIEKRVAEPRTRNYPPVVFLAYKWESDAHQARVRNIADYLRGRGYRVYLDQDHLERDANNYTDVPQYIANMVGSDAFLVVASERYVDMVTARAGQTTWVHDEYQAALMLHNHGRLRVHALRMSPTVSLEGNLMGIGVTTLNEGPDALKALDKAFPVYAGPTLDAAGHQFLQAFVQAFDERMDNACSKAATGIDANDVEAVRDVLLSAHANLNHLYDFQIRVCRFCLLVGEAKKAHELALQLIGDCEFDDHAIQLAQALDAVGDLATMFKFLYRQRRSGRLRGSVHYHYFMAETLREQGSVVASRNHFAWLVRSPAFAQQPPDLQSLFAARHNEASGAVGRIAATRLYRCRACPAEYPCSENMDQICGDCGTLYDRSHSACPVCGNDGRLPLELLGMPGLPASVLCPVCSEGGIYAGSHEHPRC